MTNPFGLPDEVTAGDYSFRAFPSGVSVQSTFNTQGHFYDWGAIPELYRLLREMDNHRPAWMTQSYVDNPE